MKTKKQIAADRLKRAQEIADGAKRGDRGPWNGDAFQNSWPVRGKVKKDEKAIKEIFGEETDERPTDSES